MTKKTIKVSDPRYGSVFHAGLNGQICHIPLDTEVSADDDLIEHLRSLGASVEVIDTAASKRAGSQQEGSGGEPALSPPKRKAAPKKKAQKKAK